MGLGLGLGFGGSPLGAGDGALMPYLTGTGYVGYQVDCDGGVFDTYQWRRDGVDIGGETAGTYVVVIEDEGHDLTCYVTQGAQTAESGILRQWIPSDKTGLQYWFDAFDTATLTDAAGAVSAWADKSGAARTVSQATGSKQPLYDATGLDGSWPTLDFDGTDDALAHRLDTGIIGLGNAVAGFSHHALVQKQGDSATTPQVVSCISFGTGTGTGNRNRLSVNKISGALYAAGRRLDADAQQQLDTNILYPGTDIVFTSVNYEYTSAVAWTNLNGVQSATVTFQTIGMTSPTDSRRLGIGAHCTAITDYWRGKISEVFAYASVTSTEEQDKIDGYLAWRWRQLPSLPITNPYTQTAPSHE